MTVFLAGELEQLRRDRQAIFDKTATVMRKSFVSDNSGGQTDTYTSAGTHPCSFSKYMIRPVEEERAPTIKSLIQYVFVFAYDVEIHQTDRLVCMGRTFEVVGQGVASYDLSNRVIALEIL